MTDDIATGSAMATWIAAWGAVLSSILTIVQISTWRNARPRLTVTCGLIYRSAQGDEEDAFGTIANVKRGYDVLTEEMIVEFVVTNHGDKAVQVSAVVLESSGNGILSTNHIAANPLPIVLEPRTSETIEIQKEHVDMTDSIGFLGVVDATGRRHSAPRDQCIQLAEECWSTPTRAKWYSRRDNPAIQVRAFQSKSPSRFRQRKLKDGEKLKTIVSRTPLEPRPPSVNDPADT